VAALPERSVAVSKLELFFDLVFVFTITQLTAVLANGQDLSAVLQVIVMLMLIWWMYDGYAWLTNAISTDLLRFRLLLLGGMGGFLVISLAIPDAYESTGLAFGLGLLVVVLLHAGMYIRGTSASEVRGILRIAPFNFIAAILVLIGGAVGGNVQSVLWALCAVMLWLSPQVTSVEGFVVGVSHFVERHGLVVIIALGESVVVVGTGAAGLPIDGRLVVAALLSLSLSAMLWWAYFSDEDEVERAFEQAPPERRPELALVGFGYWHYGILLGIVAVAAGLKKAVGHPYDPLESWIAVGLAVGTVLFVLCDVGFRRTFGIERNNARLLAAPLLLATIPLGTEADAVLQIAAIAAIVAVALVVESFPERARR
jgi:low temperature requirement protein LtrA